LTKSNLITFPYDARKWTNVNVKLSRDLESEKIESACNLLRLSPHLQNATNGGFLDNNNPTSPFLVQKKISA